VLAAKKAIQKAFQNQLDGAGFSFVEALSLCPTDWGMTPIQAVEWVRTRMTPYYPLGVYKDRTGSNRS
jgi:2-oxoglutarate ferredoxin oxidoreductase subunit beta